MTIEIEQQINMLAAYKKISQAEIARLIGVTPQNLHLKIKRETLRPGDLDKIAEALGATYHSFFEFPDGTRI